MTAWARTFDSVRIAIGILGGGQFLLQIGGEIQIDRRPKRDLLRRGIADPGSGNKRRAWSGSAGLPRPPAGAGSSGR